MLCVIASLSYAIAGVYLSKTPSSMSNSFIGMGSIIVGAIVLSPFLFFYSDRIYEISSISWLYLALLGVINTSLAYVLFIKLIKRIGPINASFVTYLVPVSSIFLGIVVLDEILLNKLDIFYEAFICSLASIKPSSSFLRLLSLTLDTELHEEEQILSSIELILVVVDKFIDLI